MALSEVTICNLALAYIGIVRQLTDTGDGLIASVTTPTSENLRMCQLFYEPARDTVLSDFPWPFATKYVLLALASDGDGEVWEGEWANAYTYPADCLIVRRFLTNALIADSSWWQQQVPHDYMSPPFEIKVFNGAQCIFTDVAEDLANIEYTAKITDATLYPVRFGLAVARRLAYEIATALRVNPEIIQNAAKLYQYEIDAARRTYGNEDDPRASPDGDWLRSRSC